MTTQLVRIPFTGGDILTVGIDGEPWVILRHAFEAIGLSADAQVRKVQKQVWATTAVVTVVAADGKNRNMVIADVRTFLMALATVPASRVSANAQPMLEKYQKESAEAIESYWTRHVAINPRITESQGRAGHALIDEILIARRKEQVDYKQIITALAYGGALGKDYAFVQDTLYLGIFGASARTIRATRPQLQGERYKTGVRKGTLIPSGVAKDYLTEQELAKLNDAVLFMVSLANLWSSGGLRTLTLDQTKRLAMKAGEISKDGRALVS